MGRWTALVLLAVACTAPAPQGRVESTSATPPPAARPAPTCDVARQRELLHLFFEGYNAKDPERVLAAFGIEAGDLGGAGLPKAAVDYYDNVDGDAVQIQEAASLRAYLQRRWALNDRFEVDPGSIALNARFPNPTFSFRRTSDQGAYAGNAKLVCSVGVFSAVVTSSVATARSECPETVAANGAPSNPNTSSFSRHWYASADGRIWASRSERLYVGDNKVLWERPSGERLTVTGRPRGSSGPELKAQLPGGYEMFDYQASGLDFPLAGCWEVVARSGASELRFIAEVYPRAYVPPSGACGDVAEAARSARWVVAVTIDSSKPDRAGFVEHLATVRRSYGSAAAAVGHAIPLWQDALTEPILVRGASYVLFLAVPSSGSPNVVYGLTRILCPLRTIIEVHGGDIAPHPGYTADQWIWRGARRLADLERELAKP